jgi:hypothetical protein
VWTLLWTIAWTLLWTSRAHGGGMTTRYRIFQPPPGRLVNPVAESGDDFRTVGEFAHGLIAMGELWHPGQPGRYEGPSLLALSWTHRRSEHVPWPVGPSLSRKAGRGYTSDSSDRSYS